MGAGEGGGVGAGVGASMGSVTSAGQSGGHAAPVEPRVFDGVLDEQAREVLAAGRPRRWALYDRTTPPRGAQETIDQALTRWRS